MKYDLQANILGKQDPVHQEIFNARLKIKFRHPPEPPVAVAKNLNRSLRRSSEMAAKMFQRPVRPREEDENLEASSTASGQEEALSTSGDEDARAPLDLSDGPDSEEEPESHDEDVQLFTLCSLGHSSN
jgi:hypothetical protein